jgi:putative transposase
MAIKKDTLDQLLVGRDPKDVFNKDGLFDELKKALAERKTVCPSSTLP